MKKILYMVSLFAIVFASCDPMEDIYEDIDALGGEQNILSLDYTLTDDDYSDIGGDPEEYGSFSIYDPAANYLSDFLAKMYPTLDVTSTVNVTYDFYQGDLDYIRDYEKLNYFQFTDADYDAMGEEYGQPGRYNNFAYNVLPEDFLPDFLPTVYDDVESGFIVELNYKYYSNYTTSIVTAYWAFDGTVWANAAYDSYELTTADYDSMGEGKDEPGEYNNFAYDVLPEDYLPAFFLTKYPDAPTNALVFITYKYYDNGETSTVSEYYSFDGSAWSLYKSDIEVPSGIKRYDLVEADYEEMGFDEMFDEEENADIIAVFLAQNMPYAIDGDVYTVVYKYLDNKVITRGAAEYTKTEGAWMAYKSTIEKTDQYVRSTAGWVYDPSVHYTMVGDDYQIIVDYVNDNIGAEYLDSYGTAESYYGAGSYYKNFDKRSSNYDATTFATWDDAIKEAIGVFLPLKFPEAVAKVDGVDVNYVITFATYDGSNGTSSITFKCTKSGPNPEFEYVEGPTSK